MSLLTQIQNIVDKTFTNTLLDSDVAVPVTITTPVWEGYDPVTRYQGATIVGVTPPVQPVVTFVETGSPNPNMVTFTVVADDGSMLADLIALGWNRSRKLRLVIRRDPLLDDAGGTTPNWMDVYVTAYQDNGDGVTFSALSSPNAVHRLYLDNRILGIPCVGELKAALTSGASYLVEYTWTLNFSNVTTLSVNAIRRNYSVNEIARSEGAIRIGDVQFMFNYADTGAINANAVIIDGNKRFKIVNTLEKNLGPDRLVIALQCRLKEAT